MPEQTLAPTFGNGYEDKLFEFSRNQEYIIERRESILQHYSTVYPPFREVSDLSSVIHNLWFHTTPLTTIYVAMYTKQLQVHGVLDSTHAES